MSCLTAHWEDNLNDAVPWIDAISAMATDYVTRVNKSHMKKMPSQTHYNGFLSSNVSYACTTLCENLHQTFEAAHRLQHSN